MLRVSDVTVRRLVLRGYLPRVAGVRVVLIPRSAVERLIDGEYDAQSDGPRERQRYGSPDEDAGRGGRHYSGASEVQDRLAVERLGEALG